MLNILVVDDANEDLLLAERILRQCKILNPIRLLKSGEACIDYFEKSGAPDSGMQPCLLFLDMVMSPVGGASVLRKLNERSLLKESIVIILSGITDIQLIQEGYQLGARTFLFKPIKVEDVCEVIDALKAYIRIEKTVQGNVLHWSGSLKNKQSTEAAITRVQPGDTF